MEADRKEITKAMVRVAAVRSLLTYFDDYCKKEPDPKFRNKARRDTDETIAKLYEATQTGERD